MMVSSQDLNALQQYGRAEWNGAIYDVQTLFLSSVETETLALLCILMSEVLAYFCCAQFELGSWDNLTVRGFFQQLP